MARSVCCRGSAARDPPVSSANRSSSRASSSAAGITRSRAAASSMASGMPSSRRQIRPATCAEARPRPAAPPARRRGRPAAAPPRWPGSPQGRRRRPGCPATAPGTPAPRRCPAAPGWSPAVPGSDNPAAARRPAWRRRPMTCSQLSSSTSRLCPPTASTSVSSTGRPGSCRTPSTSATATATRSGSVSGARSANHTPSPAPSASPAATCTASRVLPAPPVPVSVTSRQPPTRRRTSASSASRPIKLDTCAGRLFSVCVATSSGFPSIACQPHRPESHRPPQPSSANIIRPPLTGMIAKIAEETPQNIRSRFTGGTHHRLGAGRRPVLPTASACPAQINPIGTVAGGIARSTLVAPNGGSGAREPGIGLITERDVEPGGAIAYLARWQHAALDDSDHGLPHWRGAVPDRGRPSGTDPGPNCGRAAGLGDGGPRGSGPARRAVLRTSRPCGHVRWIHRAARRRRR